MSISTTKFNKKIVVSRRDAHGDSVAGEVCAGGPSSVAGLISKVPHGAGKN